MFTLFPLTDVAGLLRKVEEYGFCAAISLASLLICCTIGLLLDNFRTNISRRLRASHPWPPRRSRSRTCPPGWRTSSSSRSSPHRADVKMRPAAAAALISSPCPLDYWGFSVRPRPSPWWPSEAPPTSPCSPSHSHLRTDVAANTSPSGARAASRSERSTMRPWPASRILRDAPPPHVLLSLLIFLSASSNLEHSSRRSRKKIYFGLVYRMQQRVLGTRQPSLLLALLIPPVPLVSSPAALLRW